MVGPNGSGKTTLANLIAGRLTPAAGTVETGPDHLHRLLRSGKRRFDLDERAIDYVKREGGEALRSPDGRVLPAESFLERFLFTTQMMYAPVGKLSGGERRRLYLVRTLLRDPNFLILDEPTTIWTSDASGAWRNTSKASAAACWSFRTTVISSTGSWTACSPPSATGRGGTYPGGYTLYAEARARGRRRAARSREAGNAKKADARRAAPPPPRRKTKTPPSAGAKKKLSYNEQRELTRLEDEIPRMEAGWKLCRRRLPARRPNYERLHKLTSDQADLHARLEAAMDRWGELAERAGLKRPFSGAGDSVNALFLRSSRVNDTVWHGDRIPGCAGSPTSPGSVDTGIGSHRTI